MSSEEVENLWSWFYHNHNHIIDCIENESDAERDHIIDQLDDLILTLGVFTWEIGPGSIKSWQLTISPNGDAELLKKSKEIMERAPDLPYWEFNYSKSAKEWDRQTLIYDENMIQQEIDATNWQYVALQQDDGMVELIMEASNISDLDQETAVSAANLVVMNEIGEETKIEQICKVDIVGQLGAEYEKQKSVINNLKKHIDELASSS